MASLKRQLLASSALISSLSIIALAVLIISNAVLYKQATSLANSQLPFSMRLNQMQSDITASVELLKNWVLLRDEKSRIARQRLWEENIYPSFHELEAYFADSDKEQQLTLIRSMSSSIEQLESSQWWVEDVCNYIGNQPALVIYQRDLLPVYYQMRSALVGLHGPIFESSVGASLPLLFSDAHSTLTEAMHQFSQVELTGEATLLREFNVQAALVSQRLTELMENPSIGHDARKLVNWIHDKYEVYVGLANKISQVRQSPDWNRGLYLFNYEMLPLSEKIHQYLSRLQHTHIQELQRASDSAEKTALYALIISIALLIASIIWATYHSLHRAGILVDKIRRLNTAARNIAVAKLSILRVESNDELDELAKVFNQMQITILRRRKKYIREKERLQEIIRIIMHDIKSPLINIKGHADVIVEVLNESSEADGNAAKLSERIDGSIQHIKNSGNRIDELAGGILEFSQIMYQDIDFKWIGIRELLEDLIKLFSARVNSSQIRLSNIPERIVGDASALKFIFSTLLDNAIKYQHSARNLLVDIRYELNESHELHKFHVTDNGVGIQEKDQDVVFQLFSKTSNKKAGTGIGLSCAQSLAERLNGDITFENRESGQGVTFIVSFQWYKQIPVVG